MFDRWRSTKNNRIISEVRFEAMARLAAKKYKRIKELTVAGSTVLATVETASGIGTWKFKIDFYQDGKITGEYRLWSENNDSSIPCNMAMDMSNAIQDYLAGSDDKAGIVEPDTPLELVMEIERVRQQGMVIRQEAEAEAQRIIKIAKQEAESVKAQASREAEEIKTSAREYHQLVVSSARNDAKVIRTTARESSERIISSAREEAETIHNNAINKALDITNDAKRIAEERREIRAKRRAFIANHWQVFTGIGICLILGLLLIIGQVRHKAQMRYEAKLIPAGINSLDCVGAQYRDIEVQLSISGFTNVTCIAVADLDANNLGNEETTKAVTIDGKASFSSEDKFPYDAEVEVYYLTARKLRAPLSSQEALGKDVHAVENMFTVAGFANVRTEAVRDLIVGFSEEPKTVTSITVNGDESYSSKDILRPDDEVVIYYHDFKWAH